MSNIYNSLTSINSQLGSFSQLFGDISVLFPPLCVSGDVDVVLEFLCRESTKI